MEVWFAIIVVQNAERKRGKRMGERTARSEDKEAQRRREACGGGVCQREKNSPLQSLSRSRSVNCRSDDR